MNNDANNQDVFIFGDNKVRRHFMFITDMNAPIFMKNIPCIKWKDYDIDLSTYCNKPVSDAEELELKQHELNSERAVIFGFKTEESLNRTIKSLEILRKSVKEYEENHLKCDDIKNGIAEVQKELDNMKHVSDK